MSGSAQQTGKASRPLDSAPFLRIGRTALFTRGRGLALPLIDLRFGKSDAGSGAGPARW